MEYLTPEMFTEEGIELSLESEIKQKETFEYQLNGYQTQIDDIKYTYYKELLVYERKKIQNPNTIPNRVVLEQLKQLENNEIYKDIMSKVNSLKKQIKQIDEKVLKMKSKLVGLFQFKQTDCDNYIIKLDEYFKGTLEFRELMEFIFEKEFKNKRLYKIVSAQRNYPILEMLLLRAPEYINETFNIILQEQTKLFIYEEDEIISKYRNNTMVDVMAFLLLELEGDE